MAISKVLLNGVTQMDVTQDTVVPEVLVEDYTATGADGVRRTGTFVPNEGTVTSVATGTGLTGGTITTSGTIKADLVSETALSNAAAAATEVSGRVYPVAVDKNGKLAVNVPWSNTTYTASTTSVGSASAGTEISADDITAWSAGTAASATASEGVVTFTNGTAPSLSYTSKSIPNISVTSTTVATGITSS